MKNSHRKTIRYVYDPQLTDPRLNIYPTSAFELEQERWVAAICLIPKDGFLQQDLFYPYALV